MSIADNIARSFLNSAQIISKTEIAENVFHLVITGKELMNMPYIPGQHLRVFIGFGMHTSFKEKIRTYSVWKYDRVSGTIDMAVCAHSEGPGSSWIKSLVPGNTIYLSAPKGKFILDTSATEYLFIGDASALAHLYEIRRNLPSSKTIRGIIYAEKNTQVFSDLDGTYPFEFYELPQNPLQQIKKLIENKSVGNTPESLIYIGGDGRICVGLHDYFKNVRGLKSRNIKTKPFWMPGKKGLE